MPFAYNNKKRLTIKVFAIEEGYKVFFNHVSTIGLVPLIWQFSNKVKKMEWHSVSLAKDPPSKPQPSNFLSPQANKKP